MKPVAPFAWVCSVPLARLLRCKNSRAASITASPAKRGFGLGTVPIALCVLPCVLQRNGMVLHLMVSTLLQRGRLHLSGHVTASDQHEVTASSGINSSNHSLLIALRLQRPGPCFGFFTPTRIRRNDCT